VLLYTPADHLITNLPVILRLTELMNELILLLPESWLNAAAHHSSFHMYCTSHKEFLMRKWQNGIRLTASEHSHYTPAHWLIRRTKVPNQSNITTGFHLTHYLVFGGTHLILLSPFAFCQTNWGQVYIILK
jgi:hypothetical protein